jgi:hypothetical protein
MVVFENVISFRLVRKKKRVKTKEGWKPHQDWLSPPTKTYCQHAVTCSDTQWHAVTCSDTQWHAVTSSDTQWRAVTRSDTQWHAVARSDTQWHAVTRSDTQWHAVTRSDTQWHIVNRIWTWFAPLLFVFDVLIQNEKKISEKQKKEWNWSSGGFIYRLEDIRKTGIVKMKRWSEKCHYFCKVRS